MSGAGGPFIFYLLCLCSELHYVVNVRVIFYPDLNQTIFQIKGGRIFLAMADISHMSSLQCL